MESNISIESFGHAIYDYQSEGVQTPFALLVFIVDAFGRLVEATSVITPTDIDELDLEALTILPGIDLNPIIPIRGPFFNFTDPSPEWANALIANGCFYSSPQFLDDGESRYVAGFAFVSFGEGRIEIIPFLPEQVVNGQ